MSTGLYFTELYISYKENNTFFTTRKSFTRPLNFDSRQIYYNIIDTKTSERILFSGWYDLHDERNISIRVGKLTKSDSRYCLFNAEGAEERKILYILGAKTVIININIGLSLKYNDERKCLSFTDFSDQRTLSYSTTIYTKRLIFFQRYQKTTIQNNNIQSTIIHSIERNISLKITDDFKWDDRIIKLTYTNYNEKKIYFYIYDKTVLFPTPCNSTILYHSERSIYLQKKRLYDDRFILCQNSTFITLRNLYTPNAREYGYNERKISYSIEQMGRITTVTMIPGRYYWNEKYCLFRAISYNTERNIYYKTMIKRIINNFNKSPNNLIIHEQKDEETSIELTTYDNIYKMLVKSKEPCNIEKSEIEGSADGSKYIINISKSNYIYLETLSTDGTVITNNKGKLNLIQTKSIKFKSIINI